MATATELDESASVEMLKGITIPPQPVVLQSVMLEQQRPDPDMQKIGSIIAKDISLTQVATYQATKTA